MKKAFKRVGALCMAVLMAVTMLPSVALAREGTITKAEINAGNYHAINVQPYQDYLYVTTNDAAVKGIKILKKNAQGGYTDITPETVSVDTPLEGEALERAIVAGDLKGQVRSIDFFDTIRLNGDMLAVGFDWYNNSNFDDTIYHSIPDPDGQDQTFCNGSGIRLYSLENPELPKFLGCCFSGYLRGIEFNGDYMYAANENSEIQMMDTRTITKQTLYLPDNLKAYTIRVFDNKLYVGAYAGDSIYGIEKTALLVYDISQGKEQNPELVVNRAYTRADGNKALIRSLAVNENAVVVLDSPEGGLKVEVSLFANDISTLATAEPLSVIYTNPVYNWDLSPGWTRYTQIFNTDYLFVTGAGSSHFAIYDISNPQSPRGVYFAYDIYQSNTLTTYDGCKVYSGIASPDGQSGNIGKIIEFTIDSPDVVAGDLAFTSNGIVLNQPVAGKIDAAISVTNNTGAEKKVRLIAAYYADKKLSAMNIAPVTLPGGTTKKIETTINAPVLDADCYVKYMLWDEGITPLESAEVVGAPTYTNNTLFDEYIDAVPVLDTPCAQAGQAIIEVIDGVIVERFRINSLQVPSASDPDSLWQNKVYCVLARPMDASAENPLPAILQIHGGSGNAKETEQIIIENAKQGYVSLTFDCPAWCSMPEVTQEVYDAYVAEYGYNNDYKTENGKYYIGNGTNVGRWLTDTWEAAYGPYAVTNGSVTLNSTYGTVVAGLHAFNYLADLEYVDETKMGITGISMGGYLTTMLSSLLGDKVKAAYSIYGCGYYDKGSSFSYDVLNPAYNANYQIWLDNLDAGRYAHNMTAQYFVAGAINDYFFYPEAVMATLNDIPNKNQAFSANSMHNLWQLPNWDKYAQEIFKYYLKGEGNKMPTVTVNSAKKQADGSLQITFTPEADGDLGIASTLMYYSPVSGKFGGDGKINIDRQWTAVTPTAVGDGTYTVSVPAAAVTDGAEWTVIATDNRFGATGMTGGTYVYNTQYEF